MSRAGGLESLDQRAVEVEAKHSRVGARTLQAARAHSRMLGLDLDCALIERLKAAGARHAPLLEFRCGDAMSDVAYGDLLFDRVISLGFIEFLDDQETVAFFRRLRAHLKVGGRLVTAAMTRHALSDYVLR